MVNGKNILIRFQNFKLVGKPVLAAGYVCAALHLHLFLPTLAVLFIQSPNMQRAVQTHRKHSPYPERFAIYDTSRKVKCARVEIQPIFSLVVLIFLLLCTVLTALASSFTAFIAVIVKQHLRSSNCLQDRVFRSCLWA